MFWLLQELSLEPTIIEVSLMNVYDTIKELSSVWDRQSWKPLVKVLTVGGLWTLSRVPWLDRRG